MDKVFQEVRGVFDSDNVDTDAVRDILEKYMSNPADYRRYVHFDEHKYTRNAVDVSNGKYNGLILCWGPGQGSPIHDHTGSHCFVKILEGSLKETRFAWPEGEGEPMVETGHDLYSKNDVTYMNDKLGLHRMENPSNSDNTVTLHMYFPPFDHCQVFDERTGHADTRPMTFQ
ncbi:cysteine dioxygenase [Aphelenchoides avenae]|nr:cysteine dioxygenase [Aphelenchus avenae]